MFGSIENAKLLAGWTLVLEPATRMPQEVATAFQDLYGENVGCKYTPEYYVGKQLVNGTNHKLITKRKKMVSGGKTIIDFSVVTFNIPIGSVGGKGATKLPETDATDFIMRDEIEVGFKKAAAEYTGVALKPILELGQQVVKGISYHFVCEANVNNAINVEPYLVRAAVTNFQDTWVISEVERLA